MELHGSLRYFLWSNVNDLIDEVQDDTFKKRAVRIWEYDGAEIMLPDANNDIIFVFTHILQHFFREGIGLRQICDWCRLIWRYQDEIYVELLSKRIKKAGITSE